MQEVTQAAAEVPQRRLGISSWAGPPAGRQTLHSFWGKALLSSYCNKEGPKLSLWLLMMGLGCNKYLGAHKTG